MASDGGYPNACLVGRFGWDTRSVGCQIKSIFFNIVRRRPGSHGVRGYQQFVTRASTGAGHLPCHRPASKGVLSEFGEASDRS